VQQQALVLNGRRLLKTEALLQDCGITSGTTLHLVAAARGGVSRASSPPDGLSLPSLFSQPYRFFFFYTQGELDDDDDECLGSDDDGEMARLRAARSHKPQVKAVPTKHYEAPAAAAPVAASGNEEMDMMAMMGFGGFGQNKAQDDANEKKRLEKLHNAKAIIAPPLVLQEESKSAPEPSKRKFEDVDSETEEDEEEAGQSGAPVARDASMEQMDDEALGLPVSHQIIVRGHTRAVSALGVTPKGDRFVSGGNDGKIFMWDFNGMTSALRSFRNIEPYENYPVVACPFSCTGDRFIAATGHPQMKIYNRDGLELAQLIKGDMYIHDPRKTKGHTHPLSAAEWHPHERNKVLSCGLDCTIRLWDLEEWSMNQGSGTRGGAALAGLTQGIFAYDTAVLKCKRGKKQPVTFASFSPDGGSIAAAGQDGSIQIFRVSEGLKRPKMTKWEAHPNMSEVSCVKFSQDGKQLLSRNSETLKVWDVRKFTEPLHVFEDLPSFIPTTQAIYSPGEKYIMTGTGCRKGEDGKGLLHLWDAKTFMPVKKMGLCENGSVVTMNWSEHLNQLIVGTSDGTRVLYSPKQSQKGAMLCVGKHARKSDFDVTVNPGIIVNPHALPMYKLDKGQKRKKESARHGKATKMPQRPLSGPDGSGGMINPSSSFFSHSLMKNVIAKDDRSEDPREVFLKRDKEGEIAGHGGVNPFFKKGTKNYSTDVYNKTQPKPIFDYSEEDEGSHRDKIIK